MKKAELEARVAALEQILADHYTRPCDRCGYVGLCEPVPEYDGFQWLCLDAEACETRWNRRREELPPTPMQSPLTEAMKAYYNRSLLEYTRANNVFSWVKTAHKYDEP